MQNKYFYSKIKRKYFRKFKPKMSDQSNLNAIDFNNLHFVLCGAAITIQTYWRKYRLRKLLDCSFKLTKTSSLISTNVIAEKLFINPQPSVENLDAMTKRYFNTNFQCDVEILVEKCEIFLCHSMVLWYNIGFFKERFPAARANETAIKYKFELPKAITKKCWKIIQDYIYGYDIKIDDALLFNQLAKACVKLDIPNLACKLKEHELKSKCMNSNENTNNNNNNSFDDDYEGDEETENESCHHPPLQLISNYYKFFKCVLSSYLKQKISLQQTYAYLSSKFINYENMNDQELRKCIYLLKTKLKRHNSSSLIFDLIKIFLEN